MDLVAVLQKEYLFKLFVETKKLIVSDVQDSRVASSHKIYLRTQSFNVTSAEAEEEAGFVAYLWGVCGE